MQQDRSSRPARILVVDYDRSIRSSFELIFRREGYEVRSEASGELGLATASSWPPDVLISDIILSGMLGVDFASQITQKYPGCRVILLTAQTSQTLIDQANTLGFDFYHKPFPPGILIERVKTLLAQRYSHPSSNPLMSRLYSAASLLWDRISRAS